MQRFTLMILFVSSIATTNAILGRKHVAATPVLTKSGKSPLKKGKENMKNGKTWVKLNQKSNKLIVNQVKTNQKIKSRNRNRNPGKEVIETPASVSSWISSHWQSLRSLILSSPGPGGTPYVLIGVRYLVLAMFVCLAAVSIIDSFSKVPSLFGEATIVVTRH